MDPISVSAAIVGVTQQLFKIQKAFSSKNESARAVVQDTIGDLPVYIDILNEMSNESVSFRGNLPPSAHSCLKLCYERASRVADLMSKGGSHTNGTSNSKTTLANLEHAMQHFRQTVSLMRDIIMDARTHQLVREQQTRVDQGPKAIQRPTNSKQSRPPQQDPTLFDASILRGIEDGPRWNVVRGILDSGCAENWTTLDVIKRAHLDPRVIRNTQSNLYTGFGNQNIESRGKIMITWYANDGSKTRENEFLVAEQGPFDLLLGRQFIFSENIFIFNQAALVLRAAPISDEERAQMEAAAVQNNATNEELEAIRQAGEASARNKYREQNATLLYTDTSSSSTGSSTWTSRSPSRQP